MLSMVTKIPQKYRVKMIEEDTIHRAGEDDNALSELFVYYNTYFLPEGAEGMGMGCPQCRATVLGEFRRMVPDLIELHKREKLLQAVQNG